jgi:hypothetical protein
MRLTAPLVVTFSLLFAPVPLNAQEKPASAKLRRDKRRWVPGTGESEERMHIADSHPHGEFAVGDTREIEQIVDQARFQFDVAFYHRELIARVRRQAIVVA